MALKTQKIFNVKSIKYFDTAFVTLTKYGDKRLADFEKFNTKRPNIDFKIAQKFSFKNYFNLKDRPWVQISTPFRISLAAQDTDLQIFTSGCINNGYI